MHTTHSQYTILCKYLLYDRGISSLRWLTIVTQFQEEEDTDVITKSLNKEAIEIHQKIVHKDISELHRR